jgi:hypothetical protein
MASSALALHEVELVDGLREVPGVLGCLLVSTAGDLLLARLPPELAARGEAAAPRLAVLLDSLSQGRAISNFCLRFFEHRLHVLLVGETYLCVLSELWSPSPVLKMAMNVTAKRMQ